MEIRTHSANMAADISRIAKNNPYRSFWQAGFEGADHTNGSGQPLCLNTLTAHVERVDEDYSAAARMGLRTVRESLSWRQSERGTRYDFSRADHLLDHARRRGVQVLWTMCHYGMPEGLDIFDPGFGQRLAAYCGAFARHLRSRGDDGHARVYTPLNEISFLTWAVCETGLIHPHVGNRHGDGYALKRALAHAAIQAVDAIRAEDPDARMLFVDPLIHIAAASEEESESAATMHGHQFQAWDIIAGRTEPALGGSLAHLDLVGVNYYPSNQWLHGSNAKLDWPNDARRKPLSALLCDVFARYGQPITISETSHVGDARGDWLADVVAETAIAMRAGVPVQGVCLYPAINRPDWERPEDWHPSGLWEVDPLNYQRHLNRPYAAALNRARRHLAPLLHRASGAPADIDAGALDADRFSFLSLYPSPATETSPMDTLIVFSHLRWDFVYQRPQHLLSRIGRAWNVVVVEEPVAGEARLEVIPVSEGVTVLRPHTLSGGHGFDDEQIALVSDLLRDYLQSEAIDRYGVWLYTPMALPFVKSLTPTTIIYDCMDELSGFLNAPRQLVAREATLLDIASAVFTGGPSLYEAKKSSNPNVKCFPSSVDVAHFGRALDPGIASDAYADIPHPRLGFYGVIDERLDIELIGALAASHPEWQICIVGPVVKIDPATLPVAPNLHYFPQQGYDALPSSLAAWDVCLLPFALNASTRFISPTKTLEYMCAAKPVVSTAIRDVETLYGEGVRIGRSHQEFIDACERALDESDAERVARENAQRELVASTSWDRTAEGMVAAMADSVKTGLTPQAKAYLARRQVVDLPTRAAQSASEADCLIVGAGPTGLAAAMHLGKRSVLVDANAEVGGWCRSVEDNGFTFDYAGHIMFSKDPDVLQLYETLLGDNLHWQDREAWVYSKGVHTRYPFQSALYGLPTEVLTECIVGAIEARFGPIDGSAPVSAAGAAAPRNAAANSDDKVPTDCCADGAVPDATGDVKDMAPPSRASAGRPVPANFHEFIYQVWGAGVAKHFAVPYNLKLWTVPLTEMETSWLGGRVPMPNLDEMIQGALRPVGPPVGPNARFGYPLRGGFQALMRGFLPHLDGEVRMGTRLTALNPSTRIAQFDDGSRISYQRMISTIPLPDLVRIIGDEAPPAIYRAASALRHVSVRCVNIGVGRADITDKHWIYYPEHTVFHRIFVQGNASPHNNPEGGFGLTCEITYSPTKPLPCDDQALIDRCIAECKEVGMIREDDPILAANIIDMPYAYVVYDHARQANVSLIRQWLADRDIILSGRYSEWEYYNSDHAFIAGRRAAEAVDIRPAADVSRA